MLIIAYHVTYSGLNLICITKLKCLTIIIINAGKCRMIEAIASMH